MLKKLSYLLLLTAIVSCTKEEATKDTLKEELTDTWTYSTLTQDDYDANGKLLTSVRSPVTRGTDFIIFGDDGSYQATGYSGTQTTTGTFTTTSTQNFNLKIGTTTYACRVINVSLNDLTFVVPDPKVKGQPYTEHTHTLYR